MLPRHDLQHDSHLLEKVPEPLKSRACWMGTRLEEKPDDKLNKPPYRVRRGLPVIKAAKNNTDNWAPFEEAVDAYRRGAVDAIGYVYTDQDDFTVLDLDGAIDPDTGEVDRNALAIMERLDTYWETSVSGTGLHGICKAKKPGGKCRRDDLGVEVYDGGTGPRFMVVTGQVLGEKEIQPRQSELTNVYNDLFPEEKHGAATTRPDYTIDLAPEQLIERARKSRTGAKFARLFDHGDISGYPSQSEADFALCGMLVFWCAGDEDQVAELFRMSALYRPPPHKSRNYPEKTARKAARDHKGSYYKPRAIREQPVPEQHDILTPYLEILLDPSQWTGKKGPGAYKAYAAIVLEAAELGVVTDDGKPYVGSDVRTLAEKAGTNRVTLCRSSLPYLTEKKLIKWRRGAGGRGGLFVLVPPPNSRSATSKEYTQKYFTGSTWGNGLDVLAKLIRMRSGVATTGKVRGLGKMQKVARLGMVPMFCMVVLTSSPQRVQKLEEIAEALGRDKYRVRSSLEKLIEAEIAEVTEHGFYTLARDVWTAYERELKKSLIVKAEQRQRKRHQEERRIDEAKRRRKRDEKIAEHDPQVVSMAAKRRKDLDREARLNQPVADEHLTDEQKDKREKKRMELEYDRKCERVQERLARRETKRSQTGEWGVA